MDLSIPFSKIQSEQELVKSKESSQHNYSFFFDLKKSGVHIFHLPITVHFYYFLVKIELNSHRSSMVWSRLPRLHTLLAGGLGLLMLNLLVAQQIKLF